MTVRLLLTDFKKNEIFQFRSVLKITFGVLLVQLTLFFLNIELYVDLFLGPFLYLSVAERYRPLSDISKEIFFHFAFFSTVFLITIFSKSGIAIFINVVYLVLYSLFIQYKIKRVAHITGFHDLNIFLNFCVFYMKVVSVLLLIDFISKNYIELIGFSNDFLVMGILSIMISFFGYLIYRQSLLRKNVQLEVSPIEIKPILVDEVVKQQKYRLEIVDKIELFFETSTDYLQANFSLEDLAEKIGVPRSILSDVMNKEMKTGFYAILGSYRINYAKKILLTQDNFTIEALVYQCGFHSKSTFNKYFKQFVGQTPSSFRAANMAVETNLKVS